MKKFFLATAAAFALMAAPAFAGNVLGCETAQADNSNFTVKVDPSCNFSGQMIGSPNFLGYGTAQVDDDNDASTPDVTKAAVTATIGSKPTVIGIIN